MTEIQFERLTSMLSYKRPHGSEGERLFVADFLTPYNPEVFIDDKGERLAYVLTSGDTVANPVLWSCHVDTVHAKPGTQFVICDEDSGFLCKEDGEPLGADDGAGVWLMLEMYDAGIPGTYIFHRGEERGGIGSKGMAKHHEQWLRQFKWAIAFDRRSTEDIITHQAAGRTASDEFAQALADALNGADVLQYAPCDRGIFTDTANYASIIPECSNVSVGYDSEHTKDETLDYWHLELLRARVFAAFADGVSLPATRDPASRWQDDYDKSWVGEYSEEWGGKYGQYGASTHRTHARAKRLEPDARLILEMRHNDFMDRLCDTDIDEIADLIYDLSEQVVFPPARSITTKGKKAA
jgi:Peptidase family M28